MSEALPSVVIGSRTGDNVTITVNAKRRSGTSKSMNPDDVWLPSSIGVRVGGFTAQYPASLQPFDFISFEDALRRLHQTLQGRVRFATTEGWLDFTLDGDGKGHIQVQGKAADHGTSVPANELRFSFEIDQTFLGPALDALVVLSQYCREVARA